MKVPRTPDWVTSLSVDQAVQSMLESGERILAVLPSVHLIQFRNCTVLLPIRVKVELKDFTVKKLSFILKAQHGSNFQAKIMSQLKLFLREHHMYHTVLPKFEELYKNAGKNIRFGPRAFKMDHPIGVHYILLEDLKADGYKNAVRSDGFSLKCLKQVLKKLAQFHAASVVYVEKYGVFGNLLTHGVYTKANGPILRELSDPNAFLTQLRRLRIGERFHKQLAEKEQDLVEEVLKLHTPNSMQFNVLNHGDCWVNNAMFRFDDMGNVEDTALLDYQMVKYGSPVRFYTNVIFVYIQFHNSYPFQANDLYYTILSSAERDIRLAKFDTMVQYYFYYLLDSLKLLNCQSPLPKLQDIQDGLSKNGLAAYVVVSRVMPISLMNQFEDEVNDDYASKMKCSMYTNRKYIQAVKEILPWMEERALLD
ncbi:hypothetical protein KR074_006955 [Drosophila pseudoananassae]|nr:hypothetical protein KR074_006955 [Drosophila pseudoananassae]